MAFALDGAFPNPSPGHIRVAYSSDGAVPVALRLYDALGREVLALRDDAPAPGPAAFDLDGGALATGVYVHRLTARDHVLSGTLSIVR